MDLSTVFAIWIAVAFVAGVVVGKCIKFGSGE